MKILKKKYYFFFLRLGIFFSNWEKSHLNPIGKGAEKAHEDTKKIPDYVTRNHALYIRVLSRRIGRGLPRSSKCNPPCLIRLLNKINNLWKWQFVSINILVGYIYMQGSRNFELKIGLDSRVMKYPPPPPKKKHSRKN